MQILEVETGEARTTELLEVETGKARTKKGPSKLIIILSCVFVCGVILSILTGTGALNWAAPSVENASDDEADVEADDHVSPSPSPTSTQAPTPPPSPSCDGPPSTSVCRRSFCSGDSENPFCLPSDYSPGLSFECPAVHLATCDAAFSASDSWPLTADLDRIQGSTATTSVPYYERAVRRSSLDPCELVASYDEVWSDGICLHDSWSWRPFIDTFTTLMGMEFYFRLYVMELGGPEENYKRAECDAASYFNDYRTSGDNLATWYRELTRAKTAEGTQIIDMNAKFCSAANELADTQYLWTGTLQGSAKEGPSGQCQAYPGARMSNTDAGTGGVEYSARNAAMSYMFSPRKPPHQDYSNFVHVHEMLHTAQYAHRGRRLYSESPGQDGECCTVYFEHISYVTYMGYKKRLPERFPNLSLYPPWGGWRIDEQMERAGGFGAGQLYPLWMKLEYPDVQSEEALQQKWSTATFVQSAYRAYIAITDSNGGYRNHLMERVLCHQDGSAYSCESIEEPFQVFSALSTEGKVHYTDEEYQIIFDITYKMRNLASQYFVFKANQYQADGFGAFEFFTYELVNPRENPDDSKGVFGTDSDAEMFGLAGFSGREAFLVDFHDWLVGCLDAEKSPLQVAEEITQDHAGLLEDIDRLKERNKIVDREGLVMCADESMPAINFGHDDPFAPHHVVGER